MIETHHLSKVYSRGLYALRDLTLTIEKAEFVFLTGPSGAGKSTFLRLLLLQERPSEGEVFVNGQNLATLSRGEIQEYRRGIGFIFQDFKLIPSRTVLENISFVPEVLGVPAAQQRRRAFQVLKWVGLQHRMNAYPQDLSGGEQQRIAIARALVNDPVLVIADEPTGNLDPGSLARDHEPPARDQRRRDDGARRDSRSRAHSPRRAADDYPRSGEGRRGGMRSFEYAFRQGGASLWRSRGSSAFAVLAIALAIIVLGALLLVTWNAEQLLARWTSAAEFSVYLRDDATSEQRGAIETFIDQSGMAAGREYVSKAEALTRFRREFAELAELTSGFDENPFPASIEVRVRPGGEGDSADALVRRLVALPGVADARYDKDWLARVGAGLGTIRAAGFALAVLMAVAAAVTVATVVRLGLRARRDELEIMELVGAPLAFIRGPFVAEGFLQGGIGALLAITSLWVGFLVAMAWWGPNLSSLLDGGAVQFLPDSPVSVSGSRGNARRQRRGDWWPPATRPEAWFDRTVLDEQAR